MADVRFKRPLLIAVREGRLEEVKSLLASMNLSDDEKFNFLYYAIFYNQIEVTKYLLQNGFERFLNHNSRSRQLFGVAGQNSLRCGTVEIVEMLLENGVDICNFSADALLEAASKNGNMKFIKSLSYRVKDRDQSRLLKKILTSPSSNLQEHIFQLLINHASAGLTAEEFCSILYLAYSRGSKTAVRALFSRANDFDLKEILRVTVSETTGWLPQILQVVLDYGSTDRLLVNDPAYIGPLFEALNKPHPFFLNYHKSCAQILVQHVIKMKVANLYKSEVEFSAVIYSNKKEMSDFQKRCEEELAKMIGERIGESHITFFGILTKNIDQLASLARNYSIVETLNCGEHKLTFPIYSGLISSQFEKGVIRKELIERGIQIYQILMVSFSILPYDLMEKVVGYSTNRDLRNLILLCECISN